MPQQRDCTGQLCRNIVDLQPLFRTRHNLVVQIVGVGQFLHQRDRHALNDFAHKLQGVLWLVKLQ